MNINQTRSYKKFTFLLIHFKLLVNNIYYKWLKNLKLNFKEFDFELNRGFIIFLVPVSGKN